MKETFQDRQCTGKVKYFSKEEAKEGARALHKRIKARFSTYLCQFCPHWHVGRDRSPEAAIRRIEKIERMA